jgi:hypothetical protein
VTFLHKPVDFHVLRSHLLAFMPERPRAGQLPAARA